MAGLAFDLGKDSEFLEMIKQATKTTYDLFVKAGKIDPEKESFEDWYERLQQDY